jgi:hypothetical protein
MTQTRFHFDVRLQQDVIADSYENAWESVTAQYPNAEIDLIEETPIANEPEDNDL